MEIKLSNNHLPDPIRRALAPFAPPARSMPERLPMRAYMVCFKRGSEIVRSYEAMGSDSCSVVEQHLEMCEPGEKLDVMSLEAFREQQAKPLFTEAELLDGDRARQQRKDDIARGCDERQMRRESDLHWQARNVEDFIRGGQ